MTYTRNFCRTLLAHYQDLLPRAASEAQAVLIRRNIRLYKNQLQHDRQNYTMPDHADRTDLLVHFYPAPQGLTAPERTAHQVLSQVDHTSIIGAGIGAALAAGTVSKFRQLIRELLEQLRDCPDGMERVLWKEVCAALLNLNTFCSCIYGVPACVSTRAFKKD